MSDKTIGIQPYQYQLIEKKFSFLLDAFSNAVDREEAVLKINTHLQNNISEDRICSMFTGLQFPLKHCITFSSGKGGVGKSMLAANTAVHYASTGKKVLLFDADYGLSNAHIYLNYRIKKSLLDFFLSGNADDAIEFVRPNLHYIHTGSGELKLVDLDEHEFTRIRKMLISIAKKYDVIIMDCSPGIGKDIIQTISMGYQNVLVTTPQVSSITDTYALLKVMCQAQMNSKFGIVVNMARSIHEAKDTFNRISLCAKKFLNLNIDYLGEVLYSYKISTSLNKRMPIVYVHPSDMRSGGRIVNLANILFSRVKKEG